MFERQEDRSRVEGVVKEFEYTNPHSWLLVDVTDKDGKVTTWGFEAEGPSTLQRAGIRPSDFKPGTKLTITGNPMKDGKPAAIWVDAIACRRQEVRSAGRFRDQVTGRAGPFGPACKSLRYVSRSPSEHSHEISDSVVT